MDSGQMLFALAQILAADRERFVSCLTGTEASGWSFDWAAGALLRLIGLDEA